jgi:hypothetical protein
MGWLLDVSVRTVVIEAWNVQTRSILYATESSRLCNWFCHRLVRVQFHPLLILISSLLYRHLNPPLYLPVSPTSRLDRLCCSVSPVALQHRCVMNNLDFGLRAATWTLGLTTAMGMLARQQ